MVSIYSSSNRLLLTGSALRITSVEVRIRTSRSLVQPSEVGILSIANIRQGSISMVVDIYAESV